MAKKEDGKQPDSRDELVADLPLFQDIPAKNLKELLADSQYHVYRKGVKICQEGEFTADFFVILSGLIGIYRSDTQGGMKYVRSLGAPSWFGEMSVMSSAPRSATVITEADSVVLSIPRHSFMKLYSASKGKAFKTRIDDLYRERALTHHLAGVSLFRDCPDQVLREVASVAVLDMVEEGADVIEAGTCPRRSSSRGSGWWPR